MPPPPPRFATCYCHQSQYVKMKYTFATFNRLVLFCRIYCAVSEIWIWECLTRKRRNKNRLCSKTCGKDMNTEKKKILKK